MRWSSCLDILGLGWSGKSKSKKEEDGLFPDDGRQLMAQGAQDAKASCVFCNPTKEKGFDIVMENERFIAFWDRDPAAVHHLLAIPREHISNVKSLRGEEGAQLVEELHYFGALALKRLLRPDCTARFQDQNDNEAALPSETRYGFHIPPFRSVEHLHLHCLALPFRSSYRALKYRVVQGDSKAMPPQHKGWSWFVTAAQTIAILRNGGTVKVGPC